LLIKVRKYKSKMEKKNITMTRVDPLEVS
jgi:hypothetical protein